jgi:hypothetical protein
MNTLWDYAWPAFAAGMVAGVIAGMFGFRRRLRPAFLAVGAAVAIGLAALLHGPLGGADRFSAQVERDIHGALVYYEMTAVSAHLHHDPLTRRIMLAAPNLDDFQRSELARLLSQIPGVSSATWSSSGGVPLIAEGAGIALLGFLFGLLLAYLGELHRRHNAQWNW